MIEINQTEAFRRWLHKLKGWCVRKYAEEMKGG